MCAGTTGEEERVFYYFFFWGGGLYFHHSQIKHLFHILIYKDIYIYIVFIYTFRRRLDWILYRIKLLILQVNFVFLDVQTSEKFKATFPLPVHKVQKWHRGRPCLYSKNNKVKLRTGDQSCVNFSPLQQIKSKRVKNKTTNSRRPLNKRAKPVLFFCRYLSAVKSRASETTTAEAGKPDRTSAQGNEQQQQTAEEETETGSRFPPSTIRI